MLSIKPLLDLSTGEVVAAGKQRTRKRSLAWVRDKLIEAGDVEHLAILHSNAQDIDEFMESISDIPSVATARTNIIGQSSEPTVVRESSASPIRSKPEIGS